MTWTRFWATFLLVAVPVYCAIVITVCAYCLVTDSRPKPVLCK